MKSYTLPAIILAMGLALAGALAGWGFKAGRAADRFVTVKGVSEREVEADLALWPLQIVTADNDLSIAQAQMNRAVERTRAFLRENAVTDDQVTVQAFKVTDAQANAYQSGAVSNRFIITQTLMVRSQEPEVVEAASQRVSVPNPGPISSTTASGDSSAASTILRNILGSARKCCPNPLRGRKSYLSMICRKLTGAPAGGVTVIGQRRGSCGQLGRT